jgi:F-type H+-transporting ATPase subunit a
MQTLYIPLQILADLEGLPKAAVPVVSFWGFDISNSMVVSWIAAILIIAVVQTAMRAPKAVPSGLQNFVEWVVELLSDLLEKILGHKMMERGFWFFASIFVFIVGCNLISLVPGVGSIGLGQGTNVWNFDVQKPFLRGANADVNMTAAMSAIFFFLWFYWTFTTVGIVGFIKHTFLSPVKYPYLVANIGMGLLFMFVGLIEVISILIIRPIAFTFRLYGNIYGGEYLLDSIFKASPLFSPLILAPFYTYELLVAFIQAFVFCVLTAVFTALSCNGGNSPSSESNH